METKHCVKSELMKISSAIEAIQKQISELVDLSRANFLKAQSELFLQIQLNKSESSLESLHPNNQAVAEPKILNAGKESHRHFKLAQTGGLQSEMQKPMNENLTDLLATEMQVERHRFHSRDS